MLLPFTTVVQFVSLLQNWLNNTILLEVLTKIVSFIFRYHNISLSSTHLLVEEVEDIYLETSHRISKLKLLVGINIAAAFTFLNYLT